MKLRNKLIPLATVFATSATLAPVVLTSCSNGMVDLTSGKYVPTVERAKHTESGITTDAALEIYVTAVKDNSEVLKQDLLWSASWYYKSVDDYYGYKTKSIKASVNNIAVDYRIIKINDVDTKVPVISYTMSLVHNFEAGTYYDGYYGTAKVDHRIDLELQNIPFAYHSLSNAEYAPDTIWWFGPKSSYLSKFDDYKYDWAFKLNETTDASFVYIQNGVEKTKPWNSNQNVSFVNDYYNLCLTYYGTLYSSVEGVYKDGWVSDYLDEQYFYSYYLSNITKA